MEASAAQKETFIIRPSRKIAIGRAEQNLEKIKEMYQLGREDALRSLDDLLDFLK